MTITEQGRIDTSDPEYLPASTYAHLFNTDRHFLEFQAWLAEVVRDAEANLAREIQGAIVELSGETADADLHVLSAVADRLYPILDAKTS